MDDPLDYFRVNLLCEVPPTSQLLKFSMAPFLQFRGAGKRNGRHTPLAKSFFPISMAAKVAPPIPFIQTSRSSFVFTRLDYHLS